MKELLGNKVRIRPLVVTDQPGTRKEVQARLNTPGGEFVVLGDGVHEIRHLGYLELLPGKPRGNHYHKKRHESFYVIAGDLEVQFQDAVTRETATATMTAGDLLQIQPNVVHTFIPTTAGQAIEFAPEPFDGSDVYRLS